MRDYPTLVMQAATAPGARVILRDDEPGGFSVIEPGNYGLATFMIDVDGGILTRVGRSSWRLRGYLSMDRLMALSALAKES